MRSTDLFLMAIFAPVDSGFCVLFTGAIGPCIARTLCYAIMKGKFLKVSLNIICKRISVGCPCWRFRTLWPGIKAPCTHEATECIAGHTWLEGFVGLIKWLLGMQATNTPV